eukprot:scaffold2426_cov65-Cyclotella_meneghiniana.AAC.1
MVSYNDTLTQMHVLLLILTFVGPPYIIFLHQKPAGFAQLTSTGQGLRRASSCKGAHANVEARGKLLQLLAPQDWNEAASPPIILPVALN